ncbi:MAG TPA: hypothetical protein VD866_01020 [Urbifossiella sp.]|nr:hypothetical protein [Urbifossiella sp.]
MAEPVKWAAELIRRLKETGTGDQHLGAIRDAMKAKWNWRPEGLATLPEDSPLRPLAARWDAAGVLALPDQDAGRHLTAREAVDALVGRELAAGRPAGGVTVGKARQLVATGEYVVPVAATRPGDVEDLLPPPPEADPGDELDADLLDEEGEEEDDGFDKLTVAELRGHAADRNVHVPDGARKADLIAALRAAAAR